MLDHWIECADSFHSDRQLPFRSWGFEHRRNDARDQLNII